MKKNPIKRYGMAFKQQVVREYEAGASQYELRNKYGIGGSHTIKNWVKRYGRLGYRHETIIIHNAADQAGVKEMKGRIQELEHALAQAMLDKQMLEATLHVASEVLGQDLKKNFGKRSSAISNKEGK